MPVRRSAGGPKTRHAVDLGHTLHRLHGQLVLVVLDRLEADLGDVVERDPEPVGLGDRRRAGLELVGELVPARAVECDRADHLAAEVERLHRLEQLTSAPQRTDAARAAQLVRREGKEVAAERLHVDVPVRRGLRGVDDHDRALLVRPGSELLDRVDRAERVRDEVVRDDLHIAARRDLFERIELQLAVVVDRDVRELRARLLRDELPGHEVRVVLELGDHDDVALAEILEPPGVGDQVQSLRRAAGEDHFAVRRRVDVSAHLLPRALVAGRGVLGEGVDAAVHIRVRVLVELAHRVEHLPGLLGGRGRVEIRDGLAVHELVEDGEIGAQLLRIQLGCRRDGHADTVAAGLRVDDLAVTEPVRAIGPDRVAARPAVDSVGVAVVCVHTIVAAARTDVVAP